MINKKLIAPISLSLALTMITPSVLKATSLNDMILSTSTSAGSWTDPLGGGTYLYGGSFKIKTKNSNYVAPPFQFGEPGVSVGCNGININGGFIAFMGLDKLKQAVSNMGSSLMFGVMMGIQFTLPTIASIIAKLRAWSNALQKLLQNGCNIGQALGKSAGITSNLALDEKLDSAIGGPFSAMDSFLGGGKDNPNSMDKALKAIENLGNCDGSVASENCKLVTAIGKGLGKALRISVKKGGTAGDPSTKMVDRLVKDPADGKPLIAFLSLNYIYKYRSVKSSCGGRLQTNGTITGHDVVTDIIKRIFFGGIGANHKDLIKDLNAANTTSCIVDKRKMSMFMRASAGGTKYELIGAPRAAIISPLITSASDAVHFLIYGAENMKNRGSYNIVGNSILIPNRNVLIMKFPDPNDGKPKPSTYTSFSFLDAELDAGDDFPFQWKGAFKESLYGIQQMVDKATGHHWRENTAVLGGMFNTGGISSTGKIPKIIPSLDKYVQVIAKIEKRNNGENAYTRSLKWKLAKINAAMFVSQLISEMKDSVLTLQNSVSGNITALTSYTNDIKKRVSLMKVELKKLEKEAQFSDLLKTFRSIEKEQNIDSAKTIN